MKITQLNKNPVYDGELCSFGDKESIEFLKKVKKNKETGCWEWQAHKEAKGYGTVYHKGKMRKAHRVSYEIFIGEIPNGLQIGHLCQNTSCVNPFHLKPMTNQENFNMREFKNQNDKATHCKWGHEFTDDNIYWYKGERYCLRCKRDYNKAWMYNNSNPKFRK